ncbi:stonustoxin subunit alpha-like isoform X2 [Sardina pilchardus]|uniref:stonustoxin subunit alpha-like isoform X2 n=1 Tax=Sardina pilchardus TaxID=27697 RepID=UPI002E111F90
MASCGDDTMETAALGRPFQLGMLYDCRKDALIPGINLWDQQQLQENTRVQQQNNTEFNVTTSDSIEEKSKLLKISDSLKLSLLGGLVDVGGSAKYFQDIKKSNNQARVTLQYKTITKFETLTMSHLGFGQMSHHDVVEDDTAAGKDSHTEGQNIIQVWSQYVFMFFLYIFRALQTNVEKMCIHIVQSLQSMMFLSATDDTATHVVTAILYGAGAYFVFDRESSSEDKKEQVVEETKRTFNKLKYLTVDGEASFNMDEKEKSAVEQFSCTFHGDFKLPTNPTSFSDAVRVYRDLPNLLGENGEHAVPLRVWLYPLCKLDSRAARLVRDISGNMIRYSSDAVESFNQTEMRCRDILKDTAAAAFPALAKKVEDLMQMCHQYKLDLMQKLGSVLPSIRGGGKEENALLDILKTHESSPFNSRDLDQWLTNKEKESDTLTSYLKQLGKLGENIDGNLENLLSDLDVKNVVSLSFTSVDGPDSLLVKLSNYLKPSGVLNTSEESSDLLATNTEWLSTDISKMMKREVKLFGELKKMSISDDTKFIVDSKYDESYPGSCILDGIGIISPSKPATPTTTCVSYDSVTLRVSDPDSATVEYRVEYREKQNQETEWKSHPVQRNQEAVTLSGLNQETEYEIRATAVGKLSYAVSSDICRAVTLAVPSKPATPTTTGVSYDSVTVQVSDPDSATVEYRVEYREKQNQETEWKSHPVQRNQKAVTLSGLKPKTEYEIRATAVGKLSYTVNSDVCRAVTLHLPTQIQDTSCKRSQFQSSAGFRKFQQQWRTAKGQVWQK